MLLQPSSLQTQFKTGLRVGIALR